MFATEVQGVAFKFCFILVLENLRNFHDYTGMAQSVPTLVSSVGLLSIFICVIRFSQDLQER